MCSVPFDAQKAGHLCLQFGIVKLTHSSGLSIDWLTVDPSFSSRSACGPVVYSMGLWQASFVFSCPAGSTGAEKPLSYINLVLRICYFFPSRILIELTAVGDS